MAKETGLIIAAKCPPDESILSDIHRAEIKAVEIYLNKKWIEQISKIISNCKKFPLLYSLHAPTDMFCPNEIAQVAKELDAKNVVFHDIFWEDEWRKIMEVFTDAHLKICVENIATTVDQKFTNS